jgi:hypothetical protein
VVHQNNNKMSKLKTQLESSVVEKDNENFWRAILSKEIEGSKINSPFGGDGLLEAVNPTTKKDLRTILEFKYETQLKSKLTQCNILIQVLYYIKKYENAGQKLPSTIFVGDTDECFAIHTNQIIKYLGHDVDWKIAPSEAHKKNPELIKLMVDDVDILPFVYDVDNEFKIKEVIEKLWDLTDNVVRKIRITKDNIVNIYDYFNDNVLKDCELTTNEKANLFIQIAINPSENYIHPKKSVVVTKSYGEIHINRNQFKSFFSHFEGDIYSPKEKEGLTALVDRLVEEETRRKKGEFFTPTAFVDLAHSYISNTFGEDWKERFVVWDNSCGTMNLTRDYKFNELYCSTLEQSDIDTANQMGYNMEATKFQYDFLNGDYNVLPEGLRTAIDGGKEILFLINPPYQDGSELSTNGGDSGLKNNVQTKMNKEMLDNGWGRCSRQLYAQFLYRITKFQETNKNIKIGIFCPPLFLSGESYVEFRKHFLNEFSFDSGFVFEASHFSDVAKGWGISFTLFNNGINEKEFILDVVEYSNDFELIETTKKKTYNTDNEIKLVTWLNEKQKGEIEKLVFKSTLKHTNKTTLVPLDTIGTITWQSNNVSGSQQFVTAFSEAGSLSGKGSQFITKTNYEKSILFLTSRRLINGEHANWINWNDDFLAPNENHKDYKQFYYDSIVYGLFNTKSGFGGLRGITNNDKSYDVINEFFWLSKEQMIELANDNECDELYRDARSSNNRYVYLKLFGEGVYDLLSDDAKEVLDMATELVKKSMSMRKVMSDTNPEYHLNSWDAGYAQLKLVWKTYYKDDFDAFRKAYTRLEDRMRPLVYELGFLK